MSMAGSCGRCTSSDPHDDHLVGHTGPMTIQLVGAGLGRTGTLALKHAIEELVGGTCHHMAEVVAHPDEVPVWQAAMGGDEPDWSDFLGGYCAIVDFPGAALWREIADAFPDAPVLLSTRSSAQEWWDSANATIFEQVRRMAAEDPGAMAVTMLEQRFTQDWNDADAAMAAYEAHNAAVRSSISADRLYEYQPGDGWAPLCAALGVPEPDTPFPKTNTREQFRERLAARDT